MAEVIGVRFKNTGKVYYFDPQGIQVEKGNSLTIYGQSEQTGTMGRLIASITEEDASIYHAVIAATAVTPAATKAAQSPSMAASSPPRLPSSTTMPKPVLAILSAMTLTASVLPMVQPSAAAAVMSTAEMAER